MAIYRFSFDDKYAGHEATVTDRIGNAVTGSPITLNANGDGTLNLATGIYRAQVSNAEGAFGDGYSVVDGELDVPASLDSAGGMMSSGAIEHYAETTSPQTPDTTNYFVRFVDGDFGEGVTVENDTNIILAEQGVYTVACYVQFAEPVQDVHVGVQILNGYASGQGIIQPDYGSQLVYASGVLRVDSTVLNGVYISLRFKTASGVGSPVIPAILDAYIAFIKILDA